MHKTARWLIGSVLLLVAFVAILDFGGVTSRLMFMSPDKDVSSFMLQLLWLLLVSLGVVGAAMIFLGKCRDILNWIQTRFENTPESKFLVRILAIALGLRLVEAILMPFHLWADFGSYDELGWWWATKGGYYNGDLLTAYWPPAYPYLLSRIYLVFGHHPWLAVPVNLIFNLSIVLLSYLIARRVWGNTVARWTAIIMTCSPNQVFYTNVLASEQLFTPFFLLAIYIFLLAPQLGRRGWMVLLAGGVALGVATLTRSITKLFLVVAVIYWLVETRSYRRVLSFAFVALVGMMFLITPWLIRNKEALGTYAINTNTGINLYIGNQPGSGMGYNKNIADEFNVNDPSQEAYIDSVTWARSWDYILSHPVSFLARGVIKVGFLYSTDVDALEFGLLTVANEHRDKWYLGLALFTQSYYMLILVGALAGLIVGLKRQGPLRNSGSLLILMTILYWTVLHFIFYGQGRYHFPVIPFIAALAALYIQYSVAQKRTKA